MKFHNFSLIIIESLYTLCFSRKANTGKICFKNQRIFQEFKDSCEPWKLFYDTSMPLLCQRLWSKCRASSEKHSTDFKGNKATSNLKWKMLKNQPIKTDYEFSCEGGEVKLKIIK